MDTPNGREEKALLEELALARERLDVLVGDLRAIDGELEDLSVERRQHQLLHDACAALEELGALGGAALFWGAAGSGQAQILRARSLVDGFEKRIGEIDDRRHAVLEEIAQHEEGVDLLELDVRDVQDEQDRLDQEWIVDREMSALLIRELIMPWTRGGEDDLRFRKWARGTLAASLLIMLITPWIEIPVIEPTAEAAVPDRLAKLIIEMKPLPKQKEPEPELLVPKESPLVAEEPKPEPTRKSDGPSKGQGEGPGQGPGKGLLAFREQLGVSVNQRLARLGAQANVTNDGAASGVVERSMVTSNAPGSSGGINLAALSRGVGGGGSGGGSAIAGVQIARATSNIQGGGGGRNSGAGVGNGAIAGRTDEEIQIVFDRHKSALYRLYNRELRRDPSLRGQMILRLRIEPNGSVSLCELRGTDMNAPQLAAQVVDRVRGFDFGAKENIGAVTILYPIDFLPAA